MKREIPFISSYLYSSFIFFFVQVDSLESASSRIYTLVALTTNY